jgi:hypothetical protein
MIKLVKYRKTRTLTCVKTAKFGGYFHGAMAVLTLSLNCPRDGPEGIMGDLFWIFSCSLRYQKIHLEEKFIKGIPYLPNLIFLMVVP